MTYLNANWAAPSNISALTTRRSPGFSKTPYAGNNMGLHVGDQESQVYANRQALVTSLNLPKEPEWLEQTHSNNCVVVEENASRKADAAITRQKDSVLAIMTADCLPIVLCNKEGSEIAAIHSGWKGLVEGVIENTVAKLNSKPEQLMAWIGPAICQSCYEVGEDVLTAAKTRYPFASKAFRPRAERWLANLPKLAEDLLYYLGISAVYQSKECTFEQINDYFSYRREAQTGRMVTLIWFNDR